MANVEPSPEDVLKAFFGEVSADSVYASLHLMHEQIVLGRLGMLPRLELAQRAYLAEQYRELIQTLWHVLCSTWGDDPSRWELPQEVRQALGNILALYISREQTSHAGGDQVEPAGKHARPSRRPRGRSGV
jgi:hypothetical protein